MPMAYMKKMSHGNHRWQVNAGWNLANRHQANGQQQNKRVAGVIRFFHCICCPLHPRDLLTSLHCSLTLAKAAASLRLT